ncbi:MAG: hypothetical protein ACN2B6_12530 [Rickettsiales bacterium]
MKFKKAPDLWQEHVINALRMGMLKLQPGQPVWAGGERPAIYVGLSPAGTVWCVHWVPGYGYDWDKFRKMRSTLKSTLASYNANKAVIALGGAA